MNLKEFLKTLGSAEARNDFAARCETTAGHLRNVAYGQKVCGEKLAINIERESGGAVRCEGMRDDVDWGFLRSTAPAPKEAA